MLFFSSFAIRCVSRCNSKDINLRRCLYCRVVFRLHGYINDPKRMISSRRISQSSLTGSECKCSSAVIADIFTSSKHKNFYSHYSLVRSHERAFCSSLVKQSDAVSSTLLEKLFIKVGVKLIDWDLLLLREPLLKQLPLWEKRVTWCVQFLPSSAQPLCLDKSQSGYFQMLNNKVNCSVDSFCGAEILATSVFVCSAPTGSGKSSLLPLFLLDCHWRKLLQLIEAAQERHGNKKHLLNPPDEKQRGNFRSHYSCTPKECAMAPSIENILLLRTDVSTREFAAAFSSRSRVCIVVSQPTRLACLELAKFTTKLMSCLSHTSEEVGGRVGYAVGGDARFSSASEIIYATPGYIINALQHQDGILSPTTLIVDEAHCRDMETDLLLAWVKKTLQDRCDDITDGEHKSVTLRQLLLMSATLTAEQMIELLTGQQTPRAVSDVGANVGIKSYCTPQVLLVEDNSVKIEEEWQLKGGAAPSTVKALHPYRVEQYFIDDLPEALESSHLLKCAGRNAKFTIPKSSASPSTTCKATAQSNASCPLLSAQARRAMTTLSYLVPSTRIGTEFCSSHAKALAIFIVSVLQSLTTTANEEPVTKFSSKLASITNESKQKCNEQSDDGQSHPLQQSAPESVLVFLPGFAEISLVLQSLELLCRRVSPESFRAEEGSQSVIGNISIKMPPAGPRGNGSITILEYEECVFSVALLHSTAVGSPHQQLRDTACSFTHRVILSTNVAESSVTIPNVRCVVDTCLERRFVADPLTGVMLRTTGVASMSSLRQRAGRTGRTCDGVVFHLARRRVYSSLCEDEYKRKVQEQTNTGVKEIIESTQCKVQKSLTGLPNWAVPGMRSGISFIKAPCHTCPESSAVSVEAVLLRIKFLFPKQSSALFSLLPNVPEPQAVKRGLQRLEEFGIFEFIDEDSKVQKHSRSKGNNESDSPGTDAFSDESSNMKMTMRIYNRALLTAKGEFVAFLPIPYEQALLLYHAVQFACVEEALLIACAMTVPSLILAPRMTVSRNEQQGEASTTSSHYLQTLMVQRAIALKRDFADVADGNEARYELSEPLVLLSLLREWYACTSAKDIVEFMRKYRVNRGAIRIVDSTVAHCAMRLWHLIRSHTSTLKKMNKKNREFCYSDSDVKEGMYSLHGDHDRAERRPRPSLMGQLFTSGFPEEYRSLLANSLLQLHQCALERAAYRFSQNSKRMSQWYPKDEQLVHLLQPQAAIRTNLKGTSEAKIHKGNGKEHAPVTFGTTQDRLCAAFVAAYARNTMRGEDGSNHVHHKRLLRNLSTLNDDAEQTCSFSLEICHQGECREEHRSHKNNGSDQNVTQGPLYERLTPAVLQSVLAPYLSGTDVQQIELFSSGRSGAVRFGKGATDSVCCNDGKVGGHLLNDEVLPFDLIVAMGEKGERKGRPSGVYLAHIGISLLVSIQNTLNRLTAFLPRASTADQDTGHNNSERKPLTSLLPANCSRGNFSERPSHNSALQSKKDGGSANGPSRKGLCFRKLGKQCSAEADVCITWHDSYGQQHSLLLSDVQQLGYGELFPQPTPQSEAKGENISTREGDFSRAHNSHDDVTRDPSGPGHVYTHCEIPGNPTAMPTSSCDNSRCESPESDKQHALMSIHHVTFTRAIRWKVTLPVVLPNSLERNQQGDSCTLPQEITSADGRSYYCWVCHSAWLQEGAFRAHCRAVPHLNRLAFVVKYRLRREWVTAFSNGTIFEQLVRRCCAGNSDIQATDGNSYSTKSNGCVQLRPCNVLSTSYLNALQWSPCSDLGPTSPMAVAGTLIGNASTTGAVKKGTHGLDANGALQALHVWVLDADINQGSSRSLFVLAGYVAAASAGFEASLLMNAGHTWAYAVMLYDWGVWRFPTPISIQQLKSVVDIYNGNLWRGAPVSTIETNCPEMQSRRNYRTNIGELTGEDCSECCNVRDECRVESREGDMEKCLHWCVLSSVCPQSTYSGSDETVYKVEKPEGRRRIDPPWVESVVGSTLLIVLNEYKNSMRHVVSFADFVQRVVAKIDMWGTTHAVPSFEEGVRSANKSDNPNASSPQPPLETATFGNCSGAELLARFVALRHGQALESLMRDIGCQFLSPPATLLSHGAVTAAVNSVERYPAASFSSIALAAEGATNEKLFLVPTILPSYLPAPDFASQLRRHREANSVRTASKHKGNCTGTPKECGELNSGSKSLHSTSLLRKKGQGNMDSTPILF